MGWEYFSFRLELPDADLRQRAFVRVYLNPHVASIDACETDGTCRIDLDPAQDRTPVRLDVFSSACLLECDTRRGVSGAAREIHASLAEHPARIATCLRLRGTRPYFPLDGRAQHRGMLYTYDLLLEDGNPLMMGDLQDDPRRLEDMFLGAQTVTSWLSERHRKLFLLENQPSPTRNGRGRGAKGKARHEYRRVHAPA